MQLKTVFQDNFVVSMVMLEYGIICADWTTM